jgi:hypothetical protein
MKKLLFFSFFLMCLHFSYAQNIGIRGGLNFSNGTSKSDDFTLDTETLTGFQIGLTLEVPVGEKTYFNTALLYTTKGYKFSLFGAEFKAPLTYLEIPLNIEYKEEVGGVLIFAEAGPYIGFGLSAKVKTGNTTQDIDFGSENDELKRVDAGLNFGGGIELDKIRLGINYEVGLVNIENTEDAKTKLRNFSIFAAYIISTK